MLLAAGLLLACDVQPAANPAEDVPAGKPGPSVGLSPDEEGPKRLNQQVRITIRTNVPPDLVTTNALAPKARSFNWDSSWEGWDGLYVAVSRKTRLGDPLAETRAEVQGTNAYRVFNLEELRMSVTVRRTRGLDRR